MIREPNESFVVQVPGGLDAAAQARRAVLAGDGALSGTVRENMLLLLTELVTNAVRHGGAGPELCLTVAVVISSDKVRVEVEDPGPGFTRAGPPAPGERTGGWGLLLVDQIADRWDVDAREHGSRVWFELQR